MRLTSSRERQPQSQRETQQVCREMGGDPASQRGLDLTSLRS